jgi:hypothetical protein
MKLATIALAAGIGLTLSATAALARPAGYAAPPWAYGYPNWIPNWEWPGPVYRPWVYWGPAAGCRTLYVKRATRGWRRVVRCY